MKNLIKNVSYAALAAGISLGSASAAEACVDSPVMYNKGSEIVSVRPIEEKGCKVTVVGKGGLTVEMTDNNGDGNIDERIYDVVLTGPEKGEVVRLTEIGTNNLRGYDTLFQEYKNIALDKFIR